MIGVRDLDYIEARLLGPCDPALSAHERLKQVEPQLADRLMKAMQVFTDECRRIRTQLLLRQHES